MVCLRELDIPHMKELRGIADKIAQGAAMMTDTSVTSRLVGAAWPQHFNKPMAEAMHQNVLAAGMPTWDEKDLALARAFRRN